MTHDDTFGHFGSGKKNQDLEPLASQVLSLLSERQNVSAAGARGIVVDYLVRATLSLNGFDPIHILHELRGYRLTIDTVIDLYIPQTAICLGEMWVSSDIDFAQVTVGALRLQALLTEASVDIPVLSAAGATDLMTALVIVPEGEQHFLGASVVAGQLRRLGCDASVAFCEPVGRVVSQVHFDRPDMVLFSCARAAALEYVAGTVDKLRRAAGEPPVLALGGPIKGNRSGMKEHTGVDLVTNSAKDVLSFCSKRRKALGGR